METVHKSVLLKEAIAGLNLKNGLVAVDATMGGAGHSLEILKNILPDGKLIAIDRDSEAIERFKNKIKEENLNIKDENLILVNDNFANIKEILDNLNIEKACLPVGKVDAVLADFGLSSDQLDDRERGFSFNSSSRLDMRMDKSQPLSAYEVINDYSEKDLSRIISELGEEKFARKIVRKIAEVRVKNKIERVDELVGIISEVVPEKFKHQRIHFATRTLQAIRMEVNQELDSIKKFIQDVIYKISPAGRLVVISFHSGEDRLVKNIFKELAVNCECPPEFPICSCTRRAKLKIITKKPIMATEREIAENPRSRSAKMRIIEKI